jgi:hypothetical protein
MFEGNVEYVVKKKTPRDWVKVPLGIVDDLDNFTKTDLETFFCELLKSLQKIIETAFLRTFSVRAFDWCMNLEIWTQKKISIFLGMGLPLWSK